VVIDQHHYVTFRRRHLRVSVDVEAIRRNAAVLVDAAAATGAGVMAVVKADGYGHGAVDAALAALAAGSSALGVCTIGEALELRAAGIQAPVLAWLQHPFEELALAVEADVDVAVSSQHSLERSVAAARAVGRPARIHVEVDTGLSRGGASLNAAQDLLHGASRAQARGDVAVVSLFSHLSHGEVAGHPTIDAQAARFDWASAIASKVGLQPLRHLVGSLPALTRPDLHYDLVRPGAALYGLLPDGDGTRFKLQLAMRLLRAPMDRTAAHASRACARRLRGRDSPGPERPARGAHRGPPPARGGPDLHGPVRRRLRRRSGLGGRRGRAARNGRRPRADGVRLGEAARNGTVRGGLEPWRRRPWLHMSRLNRSAPPQLSSSCGATPRAAIACGARCVRGRADDDHATRGKARNLRRRGRAAEREAVGRARSGLSA
jgi:alanine racemase